MRKAFSLSLGSIAAAAFVTIAVASEPQKSAMRVTSSSASSEYADLGVGKSLVIDFREDVKDVLVGNPKTVLTAFRTSRRVYVTGGEVGETDVYFFGSNGRLIGGLDITVSNSTKLHPPQLLNSALPSKVIDIYHGATDRVAVYCNDSQCSPPPKEAPPPNSTVINSNSYFQSSTGASVSGSSSSTSTSSRP